MAEVQEHKRPEFPGRRRLHYEPKHVGLDLNSDANGRPIMIAGPTEEAPFLLNGRPVVISDTGHGRWRHASGV
jgi:hypothetical protein